MRPVVEQIIGAGVGGMPYAFREAGFWRCAPIATYTPHRESPAYKLLFLLHRSGMILLLMVASCSDYSVRMLIRLGKQVNKHYYEQLVQSQFGHAGYVAVSAAMGIFAYGAMVAYLIGISESLPEGGQALVAAGSTPPATAPTAAPLPTPCPLPLRRLLQVARCPSCLATGLESTSRHTSG
jgi:hypothetical protein